MEKVWRNVKGELFHDSCFMPDETRDGHKRMNMDALDGLDTCAACSDPFEFDEDNDDTDDEEEEIP